MNAVFASFAIGAGYFTFKHGKMLASDPGYRLVSSNALVNVFSIMFFIHCCGPYIGLNTRGVTQMFSGLRTEGGVSNHYVITKPMYLFPYQKDVVYILETHEKFHQSLKDQGLGLTMLSFQRSVQWRKEPVKIPMHVRVNEYGVSH